MKNSLNVNRGAAKRHQTDTHDFVLYQVTHDLVVEVVDGRPPYSLLHVLFLWDREREPPLLPSEDK